MLCEKTGLSRVFFSNSGAEANECAIKAARRYAFLKYGDGHSTIITLKNSFQMCIRDRAFIVHGGTIMAIAKKYLGGDFYDYHLKNGEYMVLSLYK